MCWLSVQHFIFLVFCLETCKAGSGPANWVNSSRPCEPIGSFISTYPRMPGDLKQSHKILGENVIHCLLALLYQWGCSFGSLKSSQTHLTIRTNTYVFLWPNVHLNFVSTGQGSKFFRRDTEPYSSRLSIDSGPGSHQQLGPHLYTRQAASLQEESQVLWSTLLWSSQ
jgi:hypothetical protein